MMVAFFLSYYVRNTVLGPEIQPLNEYLKALPAVALILLITFYSCGLYERRRRLTPLSELYGLVRGITLVWLLVMAASFLYKYDYSRIFVALFYGFGLVTINLGRFVVRQTQSWLQRRGVGVTRVLIIGTGKPARRVAERLKEYDAFGYRVVDFIDATHGAERSALSLSRLPKLLETHSIQEVFVADPRLSHEHILELIHRCEATDVKFKVVSDLFEIVAGGIDLNELEGLPSLDLRKSEPSFIYRVLKRSMDLILSSLLLVGLLPVWILIALLIKIDSKGPVFFHQKRVGQDGRIFTLYKFRTMVSEANPNDYAPQKANDPRITAIGRWLRRTSLDELPQLWNVLKGEMSLVGPRPEMPFIVEKYKEWQRRRLDVKPGLTGLWQILGRKDLPLHENIEYDFYYIKNQSLLLDLVILFKTIGVVFRGKGAY